MTRYLKMSIASLQLQDFQLLRVLVEANEPLENIVYQDNFVITVGFDILASKDENYFKVPMKYKAVSRNKKTCRIKKIDINITGYFSIKEGTSEEEKRKLIPLCCISILYGIIRGLVINITSSCPGGHVLLPALNFNDVLQDHIKKLNEKQNPSQQEKQS